MACCIQPVEALSSEPEERGARRQVERERNCTESLILDGGWEVPGLTESLGELLALILNRSELQTP